MQRRETTALRRFLPDDAGGIRVGILTVVAIGAAEVLVFSVGGAGYAAYGSGPAGVPEIARAGAGKRVRSVILGKEEGWGFLSLDTGDRLPWERACFRVGVVRWDTGCRCDWGDCSGWGGVPGDARSGSVGGFFAWALAWLKETGVFPAYLSLFSGCWNYLISRKLFRIFSLSRSCNGRSSSQMPVEMKKP